MKSAKVFFVNKAKAYKLTKYLFLKFQPKTVPNRKRKRNSKILLIHSTLHKVTKSF
ncbi:hypothetical protein HMPREF0868_0539 [Mageeibacillus indolicus UPII9-5]|uniref:Uncharacterized protein n=1 Tax=Mageeibacillus indolicus (strain UPII9-5) TaxID=699246 RepID=D3R106_MAGIU|nr:hypothetical protein HMPREF0868_0539 [Mageeibacillus indolicus UPII9-5]